MRIEPAPIKLTSLATLRTQYLRGETVTVRAALAYGNGVAPSGIQVPVDLRVGNTTIATLPLAYSAARGAWEGSHVLGLDVPLGTPANPWRVVLVQDSVEDAHGNGGPALQDHSASFNVQPALLGITILEQSQGSQSGTVRIAFALTAPDGTRAVVPLEGLRALLVRNGQVGGESLVLVAKDDHYVTTVLAGSKLLSGEYQVRFEGSDAIGNQITGLDSEPFRIQAHATEDAPLPSPVFVMAALLVAALAHRTIRRRD